LSCQIVGQRRGQDIRLFQLEHALALCVQLVHDVDEPFEVRVDRTVERDLLVRNREPAHQRVVITGLQRSDVALGRPAEVRETTEADVQVLAGRAQRRCRRCRRAHAVEPRLERTHLRAQRVELCALLRTGMLRERMAGADRDQQQNTTGRSSAHDWSFPMCVERWPPVRRHQGASAPHIRRGWLVGLGVRLRSEETRLGAAPPRPRQLARLQRAVRSSPADSIPAPPACPPAGIMDRTGCHRPPQRPGFWRPAPRLRSGGAPRAHTRRVPGKLPGMRPWHERAVGQIVAVSHPSYHEPVAMFLNWAHSSMSVKSFTHPRG
jgi:hypothetical protein